MRKLIIFVFQIKNLRKIIHLNLQLSLHIYLNQTISNVNNLDVNVFTLFFYLIVIYPV